MKFREGSQARPRWMGKRTIVVAAAVLCSCSASFALGLWSGHGTTSLSVDEAWDVIEDPRQPANRKELATTQLFRLARHGQRAAERLQTLASRDGALGDQARNFLSKLSR